jgi:DedD protein
MARNRNPDTEPPAGDDAVHSARVRARRRLVGALVLLVAGVVGFPLLFETQPRPVSMDTPIVAPSREGSLSGASTAAPRVATPRPAPPAEVPPPEPTLPTAVPAPPPVAAAVSRPAEAASKPAPRAEAAAPPAPRASAPPAPVRSDEAQRARALLEGQAAPKPEPRAETKTEAKPAAEAAGRFVVQAGAYTDAASLRDARQKIERLGMKTYTQVIEGDAGKRTRVRVGPFVTREEANAAAAKIKAAGLPIAVLAL